jgi:hypothetical protein
VTPQVNDLRCFRFQYKRSLGATLGATHEPLPHRQLDAVYRTEGPEFRSRQPDKQSAGQAVFLESTVWLVVALGGLSGGP